MPPLINNITRLHFFRRNNFTVYFKLVQLVFLKQTFKLFHLEALVNNE